MDTDALSRYPLAEKNISSKEIQAVYGKIQVSTHIINMAETTEPLDIVEITDFAGQPLAQIEQREIRKLQWENPLLRFWIEAVRQKKLPPKNKVQKSKDHSIMLRNFDILKLISSILYRGVTIQENLINQLVL